MRRVPDIVVIIDQKREHNAISECQKLSIPVVSTLDTNCDPEIVDIPIPANDDAIRSIKLIVGKLADAIYEGRHGELDTQEDYDYEEFEEGIEDMDSAEAEEEVATTAEAADSAESQVQTAAVAANPEVTADDSEE